MPSAKTQNGKIIIPMTNSRGKNQVPNNVLKLIFFKILIPIQYKPEKMKTTYFMTRVILNLGH
jgi:hypothetical protein